MSLLSLFLFLKDNVLNLFALFCVFMLLPCLSEMYSVTLNYVLHMDVNGILNFYLVFIYLFIYVFQ